MSTTDGENADAANFNASYISREVDSGTVAKIDLQDPASADILDVQSVVNEALTDITEMRTLSGTADEATDLGTFTGSTISDNTTIKPALQELETEVEAVRTTTGTAGGALNMGTFTGATISDNGTIKAGMQELETEVELKENSANKGVANGYASLDAGGKLPTSQLTVNAMEFLGIWNASTNTPTLADGTGTTGDFYKVGTAGTQDLGSGSLTFQIGDTVIHDNATWAKLDTVDQVVSVAGKTGAVTLDIDDMTDVDTTTTAPTAGDTLEWDGSNFVPTPADRANLIQNAGLTGVAGAGALTINLTQSEGSTPASGSGAVKIAHLNSTLATGQYAVNLITAALSVVIPSGATLGYANGDDTRVHVFGIDNAGTEELAVAGRRDFREDELHNTTAISAASDVANVLYSTVARSGVTIRYLGFVQVDSIATAGTWTAPDIIRITQSEREVDITETQSETAQTAYTIIAGQWGDLESLVLRPGVWEIFGTVAFNANGVNADQAFNIGMHNVAGNVNPGADVKQRTLDFAFLGTSGRFLTQKTGSETVTVNATETWYLKSNVGTTTNLDYISHFQARRIIK